MLISASSDSTVRLWDVRAPAAAAHTFSGGGRPFRTADADRAGAVIAAGLGRATRMWDLRAGRVLRTLSDTHTDDVTQARRRPRRAAAAQEQRCDRDHRRCPFPPHALAARPPATAAP